MAYTITKEYLNRHKTGIDKEIASLNEKLKAYQIKIKSKIDSLIIRHAALICEYEEQESKRSIAPDMTIITRQDAMAQGLKRYFTGLPCKQGHYSFRYTRTAQCNTCINGTPKHDNYHTSLKERIVIRSSFEETAIRLRLDNAQNCLNLCLNLINKTHPILEKGDILLKNAAFDKKAGTGLFKLRWPISLKPELMKISNHSLFGDPL